MVEDTEYEPVKKKRALRRHHTDRIKNKTKRVFKDVWNDRSMLPDNIVGRWCNNLAKCSCGGCGNQRKWMGETLQERKARLSEADYLERDKYWDECYWEEYDDLDFSSWCVLCDKEFIGMCPSCGHKPEVWWY